MLSTDGTYIYMRSQAFRLDGTRLPLEAMPKGSNADKGAPLPTQDERYAHLFSPTGFLDDAYFHRSYWMYGSRFVSGWCGYYLSGKAAPAGRILVFDDANVYGFGRRPEYYKWTTPIEHQLFAAGKTFADLPERPAPNTPVSLVRVAKSDSLKCANTPVTVQAWVKPTAFGGVILARGGNAQGYALYIRNGQPRFTVRANKEASTVHAPRALEEEWVHLAGVLTSGKELLLYIDGELAASAPALRARRR